MVAVVVLVALELELEMRSLQMVIIDAHSGQADEREARQASEQTLALLCLCNSLWTRRLFIRSSQLN